VEVVAQAGYQCCMMLTQFWKKNVEQKNPDHFKKIVRVYSSSLDNWRLICV